MRLALLLGLASACWAATVQVDTMHFVAGDCIRIDSQVVVVIGKTADRKGLIVARAQDRDCGTTEAEPEAIPQMECRIPWLGIDAQPCSLVKRRYHWEEQR
jgi:hypothetical protein